MTKRSEMMKIWSSAQFSCAACGTVVTRADKPGIIYSAFLRLKYCGYACSHIGGRHDHESKFWDHVEKTPDCWIWTGGLTDKGYGTLCKDGRKIGAHRYSYELHHGPLGSAHALHSCDNPRCVNPEHLRPGTHQDNMQDAKDRKRFTPRWGEACNKVKLTSEQVQQVRASSETGTALARKFGVSKSAIYAIRNGQNWKHLHAAA